MRHATVHASFLLVGAVAMTAAIATSAYAQAGGGQLVGSQVAPLSLSGRTSQGSVVVTETPQPGVTTGINTLNPNVQIQGPYTGSVRSRRPFSGTLGLPDAIQRGLEFNLGSTTVVQSVSQARGQRAAARSALLPNLVANFTAVREEIDLAAQGLGTVQIPFPGFSFPAVVGPFGYLDLRARMTQSIVDVTALNNYRATGDLLRANQLTLDDARELVVLAVAGTYLQAIAARAKIDSARAQVETANALLRQASERRRTGLVAQLDVNRAEVQVLVQQQRLLSLQNDFAKQKINLARLIGLPPTDQYELTDDVPFSPAPSTSVDDAIHQALESRADIKAAEAQLRGAERVLKAAQAERLPSVAVVADYGAIGTTPAQARGTFAVVGQVRVPIWEGGRTQGHIETAQATLAERRAEFDDLINQVEGDIRKAFLDVQAAASQLSVAERNVEVTRENLDLTRQRFDAGVSDNVEVVQAQDALAVADLDRINSLFAHNVAKLNLARMLGRAAQGLPDFIRVP